MTAEPSDLEQVLRKIRMDLSDAQSKLTDAMAILGRLNLPKTEQSRCPHCGPIPGGPRTLAEHLHVSHGEPLPDDQADAA